MTIHDYPIISRLSGLRQTSDNQWLAQCPAHSDGTASLSVSLGDDCKLLLKCQAKCSTADVCRAVGATIGELFPPHRQNGRESNGKHPINGHAGRNGKAKGKIVATYDYRDAAGTLLYQSVRYEPKDFRQRKPNGKGGWTWSVKGVDLVPFRLPELLASDPAIPVLIPEGERDVNTLVGGQFVASCDVGGAGKWKPEYSEFFRGRHVVILPDNDEPGEQHAGSIARSMVGVAASIRVVRLPGLPPKGDVSDWVKLAAENTPARLREIIGEVPHWNPSDNPPPPSDSPETARGITAAAITTLEGRTDVANARRFAIHHGESVRFCHPWGKWLVFDGKRWNPDDSDSVVAKAKEVSDSLWTLARQASSDEALTFAAKTASGSAVSSMLKLARSEPGIPVLPSILDADQWLLNCDNGTLSLKTGELRPHSPELMITKLCPTPYRPDASSYHWDRFLESLFPDSKPTIDFLQRLIGYTLTGSVSEQLLPILFGRGSNGKSTFLNAIIDVLGTDYAMQGRAEMLMARPGEYHPTELADLHGRRFVSCVETDEGRRLAEGLVKQLTGGESIRARRLYEDFWQLTPTHKVFLCTNHKPDVRGDDHAIWRRLALIPFEQRFWNPDKGESGPDELRQDKSLPQKLKAEAPGILTWAVRGCLDWQSGGLRIPECVRAATSEFRGEQDVVEQFLQERCNVGLQAYCVKSSDLYHAYLSWCEATGERYPLNRRRFGHRIGEKEGVDRYTNDGTWYRGVGLMVEFSRE